MNDSAYLPLTNDLDQELLAQPESWGRKVRRWLSWVCLPLEPIPLGRPIVENALLSRLDFPREQWESADVPQEVVEIIVEALSEVADFPNTHFTPDDSLVFILRTSGIDWVAEQFMECIETRLRRKFHSLLQQALDEDWSLGRFATTISSVMSGND